ncbi:helix-turn-helix domain-containing protein [Thiomicrorhabdus indica]|uniref:helix-turn-helix domain-containing protein n=1 Tax=Thiomicrorhabdus indica TaxID=2267253 RepID=UPI0013EE6BC5|nr:helix-turn-helix domain-containing protein [Thiomicrorhabdus indica]
MTNRKKLKDNQKQKPPEDSVENHETLMLKALQDVWQGTKTEGELLCFLRKNVLQMNQERYANLVGISRKTLSNIENGKIQANTKVLNQAFKPLGLKVGLIPRFDNHWTKIMQAMSSHKEIL